MYFYTIGVEYQGGTYIAQVWAANEKDALVEWATNLNTQEINGIGPKTKQEIIAEAKDSEHAPTPINELVNVWFYAILARNKMLYIDIIKTDRS